VIESAQPSAAQRRGRGKSDPIDAHLAALAALRMDASRLPVPRADGDREALRILLVAQQESRPAATVQASWLRALLLASDDTGRRAADDVRPVFQAKPGDHGVGVQQSRRIAGRYRSSSKYKEV
jgi:hypothetical protein